MSQSTNEKTDATNDSTCPCHNTCPCHTTALPQGVLSFLYNAVYNPNTTRECQKAPLASLMSFRVSKDNPVTQALINVQNAGAGVEAFDLEVFEECMSFIRDKYKDSSLLTKKLNSLVVGQGVCQDLVTGYEIVW